MIRHNLIQGSPEWLEFRKTKIGASIAPALMNESPYKRTALMLWKEMIGLSLPPPATFIKDKGHVLEEEVRQLLKKHHNLEVFPAVCTHESKEFMLASYDGLSLNGKVAVEIKCVKKEFHDMAIAGKIPQGFYGQVQHQIYVGDIEQMFYASYYPDHPDDDKKLIVLPVNRDEEYIERMLEVEDKFWDCLVNLIPPEPVEMDYTCRTDNEWLTLSRNVVVYKEKEKEFKALYEFEKEKLIKLSNNRNTCGGGIKLTRYTQKGKVQYSQIPQLLGVNLDEYRAKKSERYRVTAEKNNSNSNGPF